MIPLFRLSRAKRERLFADSGGQCQREGCGAPITFETMHEAHLRARANGGTLADDNVAAWCAPCNWANGATDVADTRVQPREWQIEALQVIVDKILMEGAATLSAAPGAGKTIFAALVFERLHELDLVDRMIVFVPRRTLVDQWAASLAENRHLSLATNKAYENTSMNQMGVIVTYQSLLNGDQRLNHKDQTARMKTLVVLDEVHHVGEPVGPGGQVSVWAQHLRELVGSVDGQLNVAAVLNLSGTLWRSRDGERISTVRYKQIGANKYQSVVDYEVTAKSLVDNLQLRAVDLFRLGARVNMTDYREAETVDSDIADLDKEQGRAALRGLAKDTSWRVAFVDAILDRLEAAHRSLDKAPAKALIVASSQQDARVFQKTVDERMAARGLGPLAKLAVSDESEACQVLEDFRNVKACGVLCTVDMAGEGYDCPDIMVVGFVSNKLTRLYIRQVVARAQRVTKKERAPGHPIPATVVVPDVTELVKEMANIFQSVAHEPEDKKGKSGGGGGGRNGDDNVIIDVPPTPPRFTLESVTAQKVLVNVTGLDTEEIDGALIAEMEPELIAVGLRPSDAARFIVMQRLMTRKRKVERPFDQPSDDEAAMDKSSALAPVVKAEPIVKALSDEQRIARSNKILNAAVSWWNSNGPSSGDEFRLDIDGQPKTRVFLVEQLEDAVKYAYQRVIQYCAQKGMARPMFQG